MRPAGSLPDYVLQQYEALRQEALGLAPDGRRGHGLALFMARGMAAWLAALRALAPRMAPPAPSLEPTTDLCSILPPSARSDLTLVLAGMVLACSQEVA